jgi:hypothetical protein
VIKAGTSKNIENQTIYWKQTESVDWTCWFYWGLLEISLICTINDISNVIDWTEYQIPEMNVT